MKVFAILFCTATLGLSFFFLDAAPKEEKEPVGWLVYINSANGRVARLHTKEKPVYLTPEVVRFTLIGYPQEMTTKFERVEPCYSELLFDESHKFVVGNPLAGAGAHY